MPLSRFIIYSNITCINMSLLVGSDSLSTQSVTWLDIHILKLVGNCLTGTAIYVKEVQL